MNPISAIGIGLVSLFILFILSKKNKRSQDWVLVGVNGILILLSLSMVWLGNEVNQASFLAATFAPFILPPALFFYGFMVIQEPITLKSTGWVMSFALLFAVFLFLDMGLLHSYTQVEIQDLYEDPPWPYHLFYKGHVLFLVGGGMWFLRKMKHYQEQIKNRYSNIESIRLEWLKNFFRIYIGLNVLIMVLFLMYNVGILTEVESAYAMVNIGFFVSVLYLTFHGIRHYVEADLASRHTTEPVALEEDKEQLTGSVASQSTPEKYQSSSLSDEERASIFNNVIGLMEEEQLFLEAKLQVQDIAQKLEVTPHRVSEAINEVAGKRFYDLVNGYRVAHFKELLKSPDHKQFTVLALGLESGFNSKATINRIFKLQTGQTPREFQKAHRLKEDSIPRE